VTLFYNKLVYLEHIKIVNLLGMAIYNSSTLEDGTGTIDLSHFPIGLYNTVANKLGDTMDKNL